MSAAPPSSIPMPPAARLEYLIRRKEDPIPFSMRIFSLLGKGTTTKQNYSGCRCLAAANFDFAHEMALGLRRQEGAGSLTSAGSRGLNLNGGWEGEVV